MTSSMHCSVCIATYKRPEWLKLLLTSLVEQHIAPEITVTIIVIDNDPEGSAEQVVAEFQGFSNPTVMYAIQPEKNISLTRNAAVARATGPFIFFIDDDEIASPDWMQNMLDTLHKYEADAVFGRVESVFESNPPEWVKSVFIFKRSCGETGEITERPRTGNCLIKSSWLKAEEGPFDPAYGLTGGEDTYLFATLREKGARYVDCKEAVVHEFVPKERTNWSWLKQRAMRMGNLQAKREVALEISQKYKPLIRNAFVGCGYATACLLLSTLNLHKKAIRKNWILRAYYGFGRMSIVLGRSFVGY